MAFGHDRLDPVDGDMRSAKKRASIRQTGSTPIPIPTPRKMGETKANRTLHMDMVRLVPPHAGELHV